LVRVLTDGDHGSDLAASLQETDGIGAAEDVAGNAGQEALVDGRGVALVGDLVAARHNIVVTALVLGLLQSEVVAAGPGIGSTAGKSQSGGSEQRDNSEELHFDGWLKEEFAWKR
jgi:hypothetical protein